MLDATAVIDFKTLTSQETDEFLRTHRIRLTKDEIITIQDQLLGRAPTLAELILWSIQGSEHCSYKSSRIHLKTLLTDGPEVILGPKEDAGIVTLATSHAGVRYGLVVSHESHNHPSQLVPYEGAATGVGGNVRDVSCMGAEVIAIADSLRFGDPFLAATQRLQRRVVSGIAGYGNPIGVPNIAGDIAYHPAYQDNCLVTVVTLGIVQEDHVIHSHAPKDADDYVFVLVGKPTDNSGFGGASFASGVLNDDDVLLNKGAIQEPNAFLQQHLLKANQALFAKLQQDGLIHRVGFKDLGAGGIACASVELAESAGYGADIDLDHVPVRDQSLPAPVILCAETQERFMWVVPKDLAPRILEHYNEHFALPNVSYLASAKVIGNIRTDGRYVVKSKGAVIVDAPASAITKGIVYDRPHHPKENDLATKTATKTITPPRNYNDCFRTLLSHPAIASRAPVLECYDKQVQGRTVIEAGCADAGVLQPFIDDTYPEEIRHVGVALSLDHNPRMSALDSYFGAVHAVLECIRNVVAVGATPIALSDCLCFGNPEKPHIMQEFIDSVRGIGDVSRAIDIPDGAPGGLPVISGNVSFYNGTGTSDIPPSPMMACMGRLQDVNRVMTSRFKQAGSFLLLLGERQHAAGGSVYYAMHDHYLGETPPMPDLFAFNREINTLLQLIRAGDILSVHDISDGGLAVAIAEMAFGTTFGVSMHVPSTMPPDILLFGETGGFVLEVAHHKMKHVQAVFDAASVWHTMIGETTRDGRLLMQGVIDMSVDEAKHYFDEGLRERVPA